jgi:hypothetical protein
MSNYLKLAEYIQDHPELPTDLGALTNKLNEDRINVSIFGYPDLPVDDIEYNRYVLTIEDIIAATTPKTIQTLNLNTTDEHAPKEYYIEKGWL